MARFGFVQVVVDVVVVVVAKTPTKRVFQPALSFMDLRLRKPFLALAFYSMSLPWPVLILLRLQGNKISRTH